MITEKDLKALDFIAYMADDMRPALEKRLNKEKYEAYWFLDIEQTSERIRADLKKIRRLAMNISKNLE